MSERGGVRAELESLLSAALAAVEAGGAVSEAAADLPDDAPWVVLAAGKAAVPMAAALEACGGARIERGLAVTKDGHGGPLGRVAVLEAGHPVPDARSQAAAREALALAAGTGPDEVLVVLLSGGASSLWTCPADGLSLADLARTTELLLASGADIHELNAVRKHLSALSGGRLARAAAAREIHVLAVSDVPGDRLDVIGSGPCSADPTTFADALAVVRERQLQGAMPAPVVEHLEAGARGEREESPKPGDPALERVVARVLRRNADALAAARAAAERRGWRAVAAEGALHGEARECARRLLTHARSEAGSAPLLLVAGGETTVTLRGDGRGGRNQELALAAALELDGDADVALLAAGTDGTDGPTDAAGAFVDGDTVTRGRDRGVDAEAALAANDSYAYFEREGGILRTGPTGTNVMDVAFVRVAPRPPGRGGVE